MQQSIHSHPTGFHFLIFDLNSNKELEFFILSGTLVHTLDPLKDNVSVPYFTVFTLFVHKLTPLLIWRIFNFKDTFSNSRAYILLITL